MAADTEGMQKMLPEINPPRKVPRRSMCSCSSYSIFKLLLFLYTLIFLFVGLFLLGTGILVELSRQDYTSINKNLLAPVILLILVGLIITINALCGLIGTITENPCLLKMFLVFTIIAFLIQVTIGVLAYVYRKKVPEITNSHLMFGVEEYSKNSGIRWGMDKMQKKFMCCGLRSYQDYSVYNDDFNCVSETPQSCGVPSSCCRPIENIEPKEDCGYGIIGNGTIADKVYTEGCKAMFLQWLATNLDHVGATALGFAIPQIIGIMIAYFFLRKVMELRVWYRVENLQ
ncbi:hypothetical protein LOTGIDRAFT_154131 [Lottia gigantea]|uniref:Tetraspanin n=1 Tax=Lottia gigantea TaxID=225164 RepID=V4BKF4_LOTGI|nr:hypothetical protein LOTGIDRAFT_154131 [Lottia gigantea]ESO89054.1 hypothetical protein LOTGIDRAFT_154131 [Lottia gigantea]